MKELFDGALSFYEDDFSKNKDFYIGLKKNKPHTLFITCVDSRIDPNRITNSLPGDIYVVRNMGNMIPPYENNINSGFLAAISAIEYAVSMLEVKNIIICGHSNCGACASVYKDDEVLNKTPYVKKWLELLHPTRNKVLELKPDSDVKKIWLTELLNIQQQLHNLITYPFICDKFDKGELKLFGWYYIIESGDILNYNILTREFKSIVKGNK